MTLNHWRLGAALLLVPLGLSACSTTGGNAQSSDGGQHPIESDGTTLINGYRVPALKDWKRETTSKTNSFIHSVTYNKSVDATEMMTKFILFQNPTGTHPDTAADIAKSVQRAEAMSKKMGEKQQILLSKATQYQGHPAYITKTLMRKGDKSIETQILRVADGKNTFWLSMSLAGKEISPAARTAATEAWKTMTDGLTSVKSKK